MNIMIGTDDIKETYVDLIKDMTSYSGIKRQVFDCLSLAKDMVIGQKANLENTSYETFTEALKTVYAVGNKQTKLIIDVSCPADAFEKVFEDNSKFN